MHPWLAVHLLDSSSLKMAPLMLLARVRDPSSQICLFLKYICDRGPVKLDDSPCGCTCAHGDGLRDGPGTDFLGGRARVIKYQRGDGRLFVFVAMYVIALGSISVVLFSDEPRECYGAYYRYLPGWEGVGCSLWFSGCRDEEFDVYYWQRYSDIGVFLQ